MNCNIIFKSSCSVSIEFDSKNPYYTDDYDVYLNEKLIYKKINTNVLSIFNLHSDTKYNVKIIGGTFSFNLDFVTDKVSFISNVKDFGAEGNGLVNDTMAIQCAIMSTPRNGLVVIPEGLYLITSLFLKDDITIYLSKNARLIASLNRKDYPIIPNILENDNEEIVLGSWEGNPSDIFSSPITIINCNNVKIVGEGVIDGNAKDSDWWNNIREKRIAFRPRGVFINHSQNVALHGITVSNTASWAIHPFYSENIDIIDLKINNPADSPNTDGCNPESCNGVNIIGVKFSVGDDCISLKSGKIYMAKNHYKPCSNITIRNCYMNEGHGAVVIGSEMSCGVFNVNVSNCIFYKTDRGLRIKTRRGRGNKAIVDNINFEYIVMREVLNPFVINMYYFCDPDGKSEYVYSKKPLRVDERTPHLGYFSFKNIKCYDTYVSGGYFYGLSESPIDEIFFENVQITYKENNIYDYPAMMSNINQVNRLGIYCNYVNCIRMKNVELKGNKGKKFIFENFKEEYYDE